MVGTDHRTFRQFCERMENFLMLREKPFFFPANSLQTANLLVGRARRETALVGSLRGFVAPVAPISDIEHPFSQSGIFYFGSIASGRRTPETGLFGALVFTAFPPLSAACLRGGCDWAGSQFGKSQSPQDGGYLLSAALRSRFSASRRLRISSSGRSGV